MLKQKPVSYTISLREMVYDTKRRRHFVRNISFTSKIPLELQIPVSIIDAFHQFLKRMRDWHQSDEFEMPLWVLDLDDALYSVEHRRLCVWPDEFDGSWHWEIQTYEAEGIADCGICSTLAEAKKAALGAAHWLAANPKRVD